MDKKFISVLLFLAISIPHVVFAESDEDAVDASNEAEATAEVEEAEETEAADAADAAPALQSGNGWKKVRIAELGKSGKFVQMVLIEHSRYTDKTIYSNAIRRLCSDDDEFCRVRFWSNERYIPDRVAMTPDQRKHLKADYLVNKSAGMHHLQWSCRVDPNSDNCLQ
ncbi:MAG: hypothetical protein KDF59_12105 [Nitrosomonas sp.]|nr:hypothetical protein [Nitrosomonas sp.]